MPPRSETVMYPYYPAPAVRPRTRPERWRHALLVTLGLGLGLGLVWSAVIGFIMAFFGLLFGDGFHSGWVAELFVDAGTAVLLPGPFLLTVATALIAGTGLLVSRGHPHRAAPFAILSWALWAAFVVTWWVMFAVLWTST